MARLSSVARQPAGSLKKAICKKKGEKKQLRYFHRHELSLFKITPVAVEMAPLCHTSSVGYSFSPIPEETTNKVASHMEVLSFGNLVASEHQKTSDKVTSLEDLFSITSENETSHSLGPLFPLPVTSEQEVESFGNLFESEKELNQSIVSETSDEVALQMSLKKPKSEETMSFGHFFSEDSDKESKFNDLSARDRVAALELEAYVLRDEVKIVNNRVEALEMKVNLLLRRLQFNCKTVITQTEDVPPSVPASSIRQRAEFFESKTDTTANSKESEELSKR